MVLFIFLDRVLVALKIHESSAAFALACRVRDKHVVFMEMCDMAHVVLIQMCDMHVVFIQMCDMAHSHVWHDPSWHCMSCSFKCVTWLIRMCDMTHSYLWHDSLICVAWRIQGCDMTRSHVWHDTFKWKILLSLMQRLHPCFVCMTKNIYMHIYDRLNYRSLLQKSPIKGTIFCKRDL